MTIAQLKYVLEIAKTCSINKAAQNLFIPHSALSNAIRNLERELGNEIFTRTPKGVTLTPFGHRIVAYLRPLQIQLDQLDMFFEENKRNEISFSVASMGFPFVSVLCGNLLEKYKNECICIQQYEEYEPDIPTLIADRIAEIGVYRTWSCYLPAEEQKFRAQKIQFYSLASLEIGITVGRKNPLFYQEKDSISPESLAGYPVIVYSGQSDGPYSDIFRKLGIPRAHQRIATTSRAAIFEYLNTTCGYYLNSIYSDSIYQSSPKTADSRRIFRLENCNIRSEIGWMKHQDYILSDVAKEFVHGLKEYFSKSGI